MVNHTFKILLHQFKTQVTKSHIWLILSYSVKKPNHLSVSLQQHVLVNIYFPETLAMGTCLSRYKQGLLYSVDPHGSDVNTLVASCSLLSCHGGTSLQCNTSCYCRVPQIQQGKKSPLC